MANEASRLADARISSEEIHNTQETTEELRSRYEHLLASDVANQTGYSDIKRWDIEETISPRLKVRADLVRAAEQLTTVAEAFPPLREFLDKKAIDAEEVVKEFARGGISSEEVRVVGQILNGPDDLDDEEHEQFVRACERLAQTHGYDVVEHDDSLLDDDDGPTLVLRKNGVTFDLTLTPFPNADGVVTGSRIVALSARRQLHLLPKVIQRFASVSVSVPYTVFEDGSWPHVTFDVNVQREVDRLVAIFS